MKINRRNIWQFLLAFCIPLILGLIFNLGPNLGAELELMPGDLGDTRFNLFILEHGKQFMTGEVHEYWSAGFMYPEKEVISLSDNLIGTVPVYAFFRMLGMDIFMAFQFWMIALAILNYWASFKLANFLFKNPWIAGISAYIYAFSVVLATQVNHAQTFPRFAIPLAFLALLLWRKHLHWKYFALAITMVVYQFYCGIYLGFLMIVPFAAVLIGITYQNFNQVKIIFRRTKGWLQYGIPVVVNAVLLFVLFAPYLRRAKEGPLHSYEEVSKTLPEIKSYFFSYPGTFIHGPLENTLKEHQYFWFHQLFPGWFALISFLAIIFILIYQKTKNRIIFTKEMSLIFVAGIITFITYLNIDGMSLYFFVHKLPGFGAMRLLSRIINVELLFFGLSLGACLWLIKNKVNLKSGLLFLLFFPFIFVDNLIHFDAANTVPKQEMVERHTALVEKMKDIPKNKIVSYEPDTSALTAPIIFYQIDAMLAAQSLHLKSINGYSAKAAYNFHRYWSVPNQETRDFWLERFPGSDTLEIVVVK